MNYPPKQFESKQWDDRYSALNTIRKLSYHHRNLLSPHLHDLCRYIGIEINSLRSTLSRIAIITLTDLFICFGRKLETNKCIDCLIPNLMRRGGEMSNEFISSEADKAIYAMIDNISIQRSLTILLSHSSSKSPPIRSKVAMYLERVVSVAGYCIFNYRDYQRLIQTIGTFLNDSALNTRTHTKRIIIRLNELNNNKKDFDRNLQNYLSLQQYSKVQNVLSTKHTHTHTKEKERKKKPLLLTYDDAETKELFDDAFYNLNNGDWKKRLQGLTQIAQLTCSSKQYTKQHIVTIIDRISCLLLDSNAKVAISACNHLRNIVQKEHIRCLIPKILSIICLPLCTNMAAANPSIRKNSQEAINEIMVIAPSIDVVQSISQIVTASNSRIKAHCLPKLTDAVFKMKINMNQNQKLIHQTLINSVIPSIQSLLNVSKSSTQSDVKKLVRIVHSILGTNRMFKHVETQHKQKLQNMIRI